MNSRNNTIDYLIQAGKRLQSSILATVFVDTVFVNLI